MQIERLDNTHLIMFNLTWLSKALFDFLFFSFTASGFLTFERPALSRSGTLQATVLDCVSNIAVHQQQRKEMCCKVKSHYQVDEHGNVLKVLNPSKESLFKQGFYQVLFYK